MVRGGEPGALPCPLLDHGTGYLAAAAVLDGLRRQHDHGGTHIRRLSLARAAWWVTTAGEVRPIGPAATDNPDRFRVDIKASGHSLAAIAPPGAIDGNPLQWPHGGHGYGDNTATW